MARAADGSAGIRLNAETLSSRGRRLVARRRWAARVGRGAGRFRASVARATERRRSRPFRQRSVSSAGRKTRSSSSQITLPLRLAHGRRVFVALLEVRGRRSLGSHPAVRWGGPLGRRAPRQELCTPIGGYSSRVRRVLQNRAAAQLRSAALSLRSGRSSTTYEQTNDAVRLPCHRRKRPAGLVIAPYACLVAQGQDVCLQACAAETVVSTVSRRCGMQSWAPRWDSSGRPSSTLALVLSASKSIIVMPNQSASI